MTPLARGAIVSASLDPTSGHEQTGVRPCVVVSTGAAIVAQRFPMLAIVPLTSTLAPGVLYPVLQATPGSGLTNPSTALTDQVRSIDKNRVRRRLGAASAAELAAIDTGLRIFLGL